MAIVNGEMHYEPRCELNEYRSSKESQSRRAPSQCVRQPGCRASRIAFVSWGRLPGQFYQVGNAVPPLLAKAVAEAIRPGVLTGMTRQRAQRR